MIRPRRNNGPKPQGLPPTGHPQPVVAFRCGHTKPVKRFVAENCPECRGRKRREKQDRNGAKKPARIALAAFRFPDGTAFHSFMYGAGWWTGIMRVPVGKNKAKDFSLSATSYEKLGVAAKEAWEKYLAQENARP